MISELQKHFSYGIQTGYPFVKESPFIEPFKRELIQMKSSGVLNRIWKNHVINLETKCEEKKVIKLSGSMPHLQS